MTDQVLDILKLVLLALLYLFFARVLWAVWSEVRQPVNARQAADLRPYVAPAPAQSPAPTPAAGMPAPAGRRQPKPARGRGGTPARLVILEPKERRGTAFAIDAEISIGREDANTIVITDDAYVSSKHARVARADGLVVVDDLNSRNGTYLNGSKLTQRHTVHAGDRIQVGYTVLEAQ
jgi:pSer/pThr/pTyr-binding forkhead associated (FHA) protein